MIGTMLPATQKPGASDTRSDLRRKRIRVACLTGAYKERGSANDISENVEEALTAIQSLRDYQPDLICLPENFLYSGMKYSSAASVALDAEHEVLARIAASAKANSVCIAMPFLERAGVQVFNAVAMFARDGTRVGTYRKRFLWPSNDRLTEFEYGVSPGTGTPVIGTEFGPIGVQICMEVNWADGWEAIRARGVKLILYPSEQRAGAGLHCRAWETQAYIVAAVSKGGPSSVINPLGRTIAAWQSGAPDPIVALGLDYDFVHLDHNDAKLETLRKRFTGQIEICLHEDERVCMVTSSASTSVARMLAEEQITPLREYLRRIRHACEREGNGE